VESLVGIGDATLLTLAQVALFCSVKCPGHLILKTYDFAQYLREHRVPVISGFHSPIEKEVLVNLLRGNQPVILCLARRLHKMRIPAEWHTAIDAGQLLILSPFAEDQDRVTAKTAFYRNLIVAAIAEKVFVAYAEPGGKTEQFCEKIIAWNQPLLTFDTPDNKNLHNLGATSINHALW
jgi:predicted Rossmann fold nucleotide-binding protein DprA/Smf involved in DNA uptake